MAGCESFLQGQHYAVCHTGMSAQCSVVYGCAADSLIMLAIAKQA